MPSQVAALVFAIGIAGLFWLDRDPGSRISKALWIPTTWLLINASRPVSQWLAAAGFNSGAPIAAADLYLDGSPIDRNVFIALLCAALIVILTRSRTVAHLLSQNRLALFFFCYCAISISWSDYPFVTFKHWIKGIGDLAMIAIVVTEPDPKAAFQCILKRISFFLIPLSVLLIKYYPELGWGYNRWTWTQEYVGVSTTKNSLGVIALLCGIATVWRLCCTWQGRHGSGRTGRLLAHGIVLAMVVWIFTMSHSVTSFSCFLMASALILAPRLSWLQRKPAAIHFLVIAMIATAAFALFLDPSGVFVESLGRDATLTGRTAIWNAVLGLHTNVIVGTGYESFWLGDRLQRVWNTYKDIQEAHNGYLEIYLNLGIVGVAILFGIIATSYVRAMRAFYHDSTWGILCFAYVVVAIVYSFTEAGFRMLSPVWFMFLLVSVASRCLVTSQDSQDLSCQTVDMMPSEQQIGALSFGS